MDSKKNLNYYWICWCIKPERDNRLKIYIKNSMYLIDSIGGGFASVKNINMAHKYLILLNNFAKMILDKETIIKCNIYYGYCLLWDGKNKNALKIFKEQKNLAEKEKYDNLVYRCDSGIKIAQITHNSYLQCYKKLKII